MNSVEPSGDRYDFSNPFVAAAIVTEGGKRYPLWAGIKKEDVETAKLGTTAALAFVQEVSIELQLAFLPLIKVTLAPPYRDAINLLDSHLMEWAGGSRLEVQFGYLSSTTGDAILSNVFTGVMTKPEIQFGADCVITLSAQGVSGFSATRQQGKRTFRDMTRYEIIQIIAEGRIQTEAKKYEWGGHGSSGFTVQTGTKSYTIAEPKDIDAIEGIPPDAKDPNRAAIRNSFEQYQQALAKAKKTRGRRRREKAVKEVSVSGSATVTLGEFGKKNREVKVDADAVTEKADSVSYQFLKKNPINYSQGGKTDWQAVWELAREAQCFSYWEGSTLKISPRNTSFATASVKRVFRLYHYPGGIIGPSNGVFPILSASSPAMYLYMSGATKAMAQSGVNKETRKAETSIVDDALVRPARSGKGGTAMADSATMPPVDAYTGTNAATFPGNPSSDRAATQAKAEFAAMSDQAGIQLTIESLADPRLAPGDAVFVRGLGNRLDKRYVIFKLTYTLGGGGGSMSAEMRSNAAVVDKTLNPKGPTSPLEMISDPDYGVDPRTGQINVDALLI